ncbi:unnamed protein product [Eruca vesicaria subsp. sativa]|uniref:Uncharacterized protein n=1 Tax=Eruca vesicaria subsp. sativa TaxID=29727 RepID=A0ABC8K9E3_ERUVS|nr:unnamed protein product [Eruca vesicaria subsp. sativa]
MRLLNFDSFGHGSLPLRPYDIRECPLGRWKREVKPKEEELKIESSDEPKSLPEDEKMSEATTSTPPPPLSSTVHKQSLRMADLALENKKKKQPAPKAIHSMESKAST